MSTFIKGDALEREMSTTMPSYFDQFEDEAPAAARSLKDCYQFIGVQAMTVSVGGALAAGLLGAEGAKKALARLDDIRREIARDVGIVIPGVHLRDDTALGEWEYCIHVGDFMVAKGALRPPGMLLALGKPLELEPFEGEAAKEPVYGLPAKWVDAANMADLRAANIVYFDSVSVLASHVGQIARDYLAELFTLEAYAAYVEYLATRVPVLMEEFQAAVSRRTAHRAIRVLLEEYVWPRDPVRMFEQFLITSERTLDPVLLAESARKKLVMPMLARRKSKVLRVCKIDPTLVADITRAMGSEKPGPTADAPALAGTDLGLYLRKQIIALSKEHAHLSVVTPPHIRRAVAELFPRFRNRVPVYATDEINRDLRIDELAVLKATSGQLYVINSAQVQSSASNGKRDGSKRTPDSPAPATEPAGPGDTAAGEATAAVDAPGVIGDTPARGARARRTPKE